MKSNIVNTRRVLGALIIMCFTGAAFGQSGPLWSQSFQSDIKWQHLAPSGQVVVSTDDGMSALDPATGDVLWSNDYEDVEEWEPQDFGSWLEQYVPYSSLAIIRKCTCKNPGKRGGRVRHYINVLDVATGNVLWSTETLDIKDHYGYYLLPESGSMLLYGKDSDGKKTIFSIELGTGTVLWQSRDLYNDKAELFMAPIADTGDTILTFMGKKSIWKLNARTGEQIWKTELEAKKGFEFSLLNEAGNVVFTASDKRVYAINTSDGSFAWPSAPKFKGDIIALSEMPVGLVIIGSNFLNVVDPASGVPVWNKAFKKGISQMEVLDVGILVKDAESKMMTLLDPATGAPVWDKEFKKLKKSTDFSIVDDRIIVFADKRLYSISLSDGSYKELAKDLKFEGKQDPEFLEAREDGYFLRSANNLMLVSRDGQPIFHRYYKAPGLSFTQKLARQFVNQQVNKLAIEMARSGWTVMETAGARKPGDLWAPVTPSADQEQYASDLSSYLNNVRFTATMDLDTYMYILTEVQTDSNKGVGLVKVNKFTGETEDKLILGSKSPDYEVDELESRLTFVKGKREIVCYSF